MDISAHALLPSPPPPPLWTAHLRHLRSVNVIEGEPNDRQMTTGNHTVRDIYCVKCGQTLGWKYDYAYEPSQKYKEGKFILERNLLVDVQ
ncbi:Protein yippee-like [Trametes pubescens]|uniref:Protein yippee-like n=1 Tax=Trametes pubescens TaxID=154538 RepID=A0A1M2W818_TRAPU|nr:Protein yippee-like [Trametes pubescens]